MDCPTNKVFGRMFPRFTSGSRRVRRGLWEATILSREIWGVGENAYHPVQASGQGRTQREAFCAAFRSWDWAGLRPRGASDG